MFFFVILLLFPMMIQHIAVKGYHTDYQKRNTNALTFFFVLLTVLVMLRHESVGNDTRNYISYFEQFSLMDWNMLKRSTLEIGYALYNKVVSLFSKEPQFFLAVAALTVSALIYPTYKRLCVDTSLTIVLFCFLSTFVMMFSGIRQMLAVGIGFVSYELTRRGKLVFFILTVLLAMSFHTSAFMLIVMYPLYHARITKKWFYVGIPVLLFLFARNEQVFSALALILEQYTEYDTEISATGAYTVLILFCAFTAFAYLIPDERRMDEEMIGLRNFLLISLVIQMFAPLHSLAMRMNYYYIIFIPLLIPKIIEARSKRWNQVAIAGRHIMVVFFVLYFFYNANSGENLNVFPYHFFWEKI